MKAKTKASLYVFFKPFLEIGGLFIGFLILAAIFIFAVIGGYWLFKLPFVLAVFIAPSLATNAIIIGGSNVMSFCGAIITPLLLGRAIGFYADKDEQIEVEKKAAEFAKSEPSPDGPNKGGLSLFKGGDITEIK